jgi:hypothetical protein
MAWGAAYLTALSGLSIPLMLTGPESMAVRSRALPFIFYPPF